MAKFKSSFFSDESYNYTNDVLEKIFKDLRNNPTYVVARCEKTGEVNSPANIKLDTEVDKNVKRNWEINDQSDIAKICEGYLEYTPESITTFRLNPESPVEMFMQELGAEEVLTYGWDSKLKTLTLK